MVILATPVKFLRSSFNVLYSSWDWDLLLNIIRGNCYAHRCWASAHHWLPGKCFPSIKERFCLAESRCWALCKSSLLFQQPGTFFSLLYGWKWTAHNMFLTFSYVAMGAELAVRLLGSVLPVGLGLPLSKVEMTRVWPVFCLLSFSQRVQVVCDQILMTSTLDEVPKFSKKCQFIPNVAAAPGLESYCHRIGYICGIYVPTGHMNAPWKGL